MALITTYTTADTIRALLGVSNLEITDAEVSLPIYGFNFELEAEDIDKGVAGVTALYATYKAIASNVRTAQQQRFVDLFELLAAYSGARQLLGAVDMFAPQEITDGKAKTTRVDAQTERLVKAVNAAYTLVRQRLAALYLVINPTADLATAEARTFIGDVGLGSDPVLGT